MSQSARNAAFLLALAALVGVLAYGLSQRRIGPRELLASAPARARILAELDVPSLRRSSLFRDLIGASDAGLDHIRETCGFDPLDMLETVQVYVLASAEEDEDGFDDVALLGRGALDHDALARCVGEVVEGDGGGVHRTSIEGVDALASDHGSSVAAFLGRDGVVAGPHEVVAELLRIQAGASPAMPRDADLTRLLRRAGPGAHLRLVALLPPHWQRFLGRIAELAGEIPLDRARALGLGASLDDGIAVTLAVDLGGADDAEESARSITEHLAEARRDPELAGSALSVTLARVHVSSHGPDVVAEASLDRAELDATVALVRRYMARERALGGDE